METIKGTASAAGTSASRTYPEPGGNSKPSMAVGESTPSPAGKSYVFQRPDVSSVFSTHVVLGRRGDYVTPQHRAKVRSGYPVTVRGQRLGGGGGSAGSIFAARGEFAGRLGRKSFRCPAG
ncbi:hypothetical protein KM043_008323 [Ampulex compressa]|nr:hypothetical protein KM043_008323 [Ampulex compressa]